MKKILFLILFISFNSFSSEICQSFKYQKDNITVLTKQSFVTLKYMKFESTFDCKKEGSTYTCNGDDDSAKFKYFKDVNKLQIDHISFGEPDSDMIQILKQELTGTKCH